MQLASITFRSKFKDSILQSHILVPLRSLGKHYTDTKSHKWFVTPDVSY